ncbi:GtrA family protein [Vibrio sp. NTOU-M3]|uniref:GtrA family protein n=1 Tax=Vibrio sp. NTOU-M3 TaxID=3234954 RepID=UPI00349F5B86
MIGLLQSNETLKQFFLYGVTGATLNFLGFGLYIVLTWFGVEPKLAMLFVYNIGIVSSFFANRKLVFGAKHTGFRIIVKFLAAHVIGYSINFLLLYYFYEQMGFAHQVVQFSAILIVALYLFVVFKFWVFRKPSSNLLIKGG